MMERRRKVKVRFTCKSPLFRVFQSVRMEFMFQTEISGWIEISGEVDTHKIEIKKGKPTLNFKLKRALHITYSITVVMRMRKLAGLKPT